MRRNQRLREEEEEEVDEEEEQEEQEEEEEEEEEEQEPPRRRGHPTPSRGPSYAHMRPNDAPPAGAIAVADQFHNSASYITVRIPISMMSHSRKKKEVKWFDANELVKIDITPNIRRALKSYVFVQRNKEGHWNPISSDNLAALNFFFVCGKTTGMTSNDFPYGISVDSNLPSHKKLGHFVHLIEALEFQGDSEARKNAIFAANESHFDVLANTPPTPWEQCFFGHELGEDQKNRMFKFRDLLSRGVFWENESASPDGRCFVSERSEGIRIAREADIKAGAPFYTVGISPSTFEGLVLLTKECKSLIETNFENSRKSWGCPNSFSLSNPVEITLFRTDVPLLQGRSPERGFDSGYWTKDFNQEALTNVSFHTSIELQLLTFLS
jgi:hypothetical protein